MVEILRQYVVSGERTIAAQSSDPLVRIYAATNGGGYSLLLVNTDSTSARAVPISIQNSAKQSFTASQVSYGKLEYDQSASKKWVGPTSTSLGTVGTAFGVSLPPWSVPLVKVQ